MHNIKHHELAIAYEKAREVREFLGLDRRVDNFVSLSDLVSATENISGLSQILIQRCSFSDDPNLHHFATTPSMLQIKDNSATILVNTDYDANVQRFAVVHELGNILMCDRPTSSDYVASKYVNPDITAPMPESDSSYSMRERLANIFAVLVLVHRDIKISDIKKNGIDRLKSDFGVEEDAIMSRMILSWSCV